MRLLYAFILGMMSMPCMAFAQFDDVMSSTSSLQSVLSDLKESVDKLGVDNDQLAAKDQSIKEQISQLQLQMDHLSAQGDILNKSVARLQQKNPGRSRQITRMEKENFELDDRLQKDEGGIKLIQQSLNAGFKEEEKLLLQLKGMTNALPPSFHAQPPRSPSTDHFLKEKLILMKMISESQKRQEALHRSILKFQKKTPVLPATDALARQEQLKAEVKDLEAQIAAYPPENLSAAAGNNNQLNDDQLRQLEVELKTLEQNYLQFKNLMEQMNKKAKESKMTISQHVEGDKLQSSLDDLNHQGQGLKVDLDDLRNQMVDLDKRKSQLEVMIKHLP